MTDLTREQQLELQRNHYIQENESLRERVEELEKLLGFFTTSQHGDLRASMVDTIRTEAKDRIHTLTAQLEHMDYKYHEAVKAGDGYATELKQQLATAREQIERLESEAGYHGAKEVISQLTDQCDVLAKELAKLHAQRTQMEEALWPQATGSDKQGGWKLKLSYLTAIQNMLVDDEDAGRPHLEQIEAILLAQAALGKVE